MMNHLPSDILSKEIIPQLSYEDQISFAMSNVMLSNLLLKQIRTIHILSAHTLFKPDPVRIDYTCTLPLKSFVIRFMDYFRTLIIS